MRRPAACGPARAAVRTPARGRPTTLRGVLNHVRQGSGEPLELIHGIGSQWQAWTPVLERLARERDVVALDLPGFGASAALEGEVTIARALATGCWFRVRAGARAGYAGRYARLAAGRGHVPTRDDPAQVAAVLLAGSRS
jgi:pimeloyl-ACP methyl ester carboxylesterase